MEKTIAAISTGLTEAGISVIRISGPEAISVAEKVFISVSGKKLSEMNGYTCALGKAVTNKRSIDECIATVFRAPKSYTGEDVVELSCHGGIIVTRDILRAVLEAGASPAQPGEFTKRAFLNGKMDLMEAESVMNLISAKSSGEAHAALSVKEGHLSEEIQNIKRELVGLAAHLNAWADYPEEDIPEIDPKSIAILLNVTLGRISSILHRYDVGKVFSGGINTVIIGKPNVGKSTLMNKLAGYDRSIVTSIPGTTRDTIEEQVFIGEQRLNLIDTAGIRETDDEVEKIGVERAKKELEKAQFVFFIADATKPLDEEDFRIFETIPKNIPTLILFNKADLFGKEMDFEKYEKIRASYDKLIERNNLIQYSMFVVSMKDDSYDSKWIDKFNLKRIEKYMERFLLGRDGSFSNDVISYNERQHILIRNASDSLLSARFAIDKGETLDAVTVLIEECISSLAELTGENVTDEIVDKVFHNFCVGK